MERNAYCTGSPLTVGSEPVLLLDDAYVEDRWGVKRVLNVPRKDSRNPLLVADQPWEDVACGGSVLYDEEAGLYRLWYTVMDRLAWEHQFRRDDWSYEKHGMPYYCAYAESEDGVHWQKPLLDNKPYREHPKTNVVLRGEQKIQAAYVTWNHPASGQPGRFMMTFKDNLAQGHGCLCLAYSDDGINWRLDPGSPIKVGVRDTLHNVVYDEKRGRWLLFTRPVVLVGTADMADHPEHNFKRRVAVAVGDSLQTLGLPRVVMWPDEHDAYDFDNMTVNRVGNHFIGMLAQMGPHPKQEFDVHLASSADGLHWQQLPDRAPILPRGAPGQFDSGITSSVSPIVKVKDTWYLYYRGCTGGQGEKPRDSGLGRAELPRERLVAQTAGPVGGFLLTREIVVAGPDLLLNMAPANAGEPAEIAVEIMATPDDGGTPRHLPGYTFDDCTTGAVDSLEQPVTWADKPSLAPLVGRPVYVRFFLRNVGLYSLRFAGQ